MSQHVSQNPKTPEEREHNRTAIAEVEAEIAIRSAEIEAQIGALIETHRARLRGLGLHHPRTMVVGAIVADMDQATTAALVRLEVMKRLADVLREELAEAETYEEVPWAGGDSFFGPV
jgi:hypothetical protein